MGLLPKFGKEKRLPPQPVLRQSISCWIMSCVLVSLLSVGSCLLADELDNPAVLPPVAHPGSDGLPVRVALVDSGVNYLLPQINAHLLPR